MVNYLRVLVECANEILQTYRVKETLPRACDMSCGAKKLFRHLE